MVLYIFVLIQLCIHAHRSYGLPVGHIIDIQSSRNTIHVADALPSSITRAFTNPHSHQLTGHTRYRTQNIVVDNNPDTIAGCSGLDYYIDVEIGATGLPTTKTYRLIVDSGSTTMAVAGYQCPIGTAVGDCFPYNNQPQYIPTNTSSIVQTSPISGTYGGNTGWTGLVYNDQVTVGSTSTIPLNFAVMTSSDSFFNTNGCYNSKHSAVNNQGILGVAYSSLAIQPTESWLQKIVQYKNMPNIFSMQMCETTGKLWLGGIPDSSYCASGSCDPANIKSGGAYVPIVDQSYYSVKMVDVYLSTTGSTNTYTPSTFGQTIVDSGTTQITLPQQVFDAIAQQLAGDTVFQQALPQASGVAFFAGTQCVQSSYTITQLNDMLPLITIVLCGDISCSAGKNFNLVAANSYLQQLISVDSNGNIQNYYCSGIGVNPVGTGNTILGYSFMNQFITIFDIQNSQIGLVPVANCPTVGSTVADNSYQWSTTSWGSCTGTCNGGSGIQQRSAKCIDDQGIHYIDARCSGSKPVTQQSCIGAAYCGEYDSINVCPSTMNCGNSSQGFCQAGMCLCINGWAGDHCDQQPHIIVNSATYINEVITMNYSASGQFSQTAMFVAPYNYTPGAIPQTQFPRYIDDIRSYTINTTDTSAIATFSSYVAPSDNHVIGIAYSPTLYSYAIPAQSLTTVDCTKQCQYGGTYSAGTCTCQCPTQMTIQNNNCTCTLQCSAGSTPDSTCGYCTGCPTVASTSRWSGVSCNQPYSPITLTLHNIQYSSINGSQAIAFQRSLTSDIAYSIGVSDLQIVFDSVQSTGTNTISVAMLILGTVGDADTTTVDGYAYNLKYYSNALLQQGLISSYVTSVDAPYAKAIHSSSASSGGGLSAVAKWFVTNYIYVAAIGGTIVGLIVTGIIVRLVCFKKTKDITLVDTPKPPMYVEPRSRRHSQPTNAQAYIDTAVNTANNTVPNTPQRRSSIDTTDSPSHIVDVMDMSRLQQHNNITTPIRNSNITRLRYSYNDSPPHNSSTDHTPVPITRRINNPALIETNPNSASSSPAPSYRSRFAQPIPFNFPDPTNSTIPPQSSSWIRYTTSDNRPYWFNTSLGETSWIDPHQH